MSENLAHRISLLTIEQRGKVESLIDQYQECLSFSKKIPIFEKLILDRNFTEKGYSQNFGNQYKSVYICWDIYRSYHDQESITNYTGKDVEGYFFKVYVNTYHLYDSHAKYDLSQLAKHSFYFDELNSSFYIKDESIENFLEEFVIWYKVAIKKNAKDKKTKREKELRDELAKLEHEL